MRSTGHRMRASKPIPVVDIAAIGGSDRVAEAAAVDALTQACTTTGFFHVAGHGVPEDAVDAALAAARWFFALPQPDRDALDVARSPCFRGYVPMGITGPGVPRRLLEAFQMMLDLGPDDPDVRAGSVMHGPNVWPPDAPEFRRALDRYYAAMTALSARLLSGFALGLGLAADHFAPAFAKPLTQRCLLRYPPQPAEAGEAALGVEAHTDTGAFTILAQDDTGGLEVRLRSGGWVPSAPVPGTFVVNIGEMMQRWSNGRFVSTPHRVANRSGRSRHSIPFFANPDYGAVVAPLPCYVTADRPDGYGPLACGPYVEAAYRAAWPLAG